MKKNNGIYGELNKNFMELYGDKLFELDKDILIKIIAIMHTTNMRIGDKITAFQKCETSENAEEIIRIIAKELKYANMPFYALDIEDLKEDVNNRYNG